MNIEGGRGNAFFARTTLLLECVCRQVLKVAKKVSYGTEGIRRKVIFNLSDFIVNPNNETSFT